MKINFDEIARAKEQRENQLEPRIERIEGQLISVDSAGSAEVATRPGWVWYRRPGFDASPGIALQGNVQATPNVPVIIERQLPNGEWQIVGERTELNTVLDDYEGRQLQRLHAKEHEPGGVDPLYVYQKMLVPLRTSPQDGLKVNIAALKYTYRDTKKTFAAYNNYDLSSSKPAAGLARYVLIYLDPATNTLGTTNGTTTVDSDAIQPVLPSVPNDVYPSAYVRLDGSQTTIRENDIVDGRSFLNDAANDASKFFVEPFFNGTFVESFDALVTSNGTTVTLSLEQKGGGDLTMQFSSGRTILDCTPAQTITLTAGTSGAGGITPQKNYTYILESTGVLTNNTSDWPATEHIKVAFTFVPDAATVQSDGGAFINQNWNDERVGSDGMGHVTHMGQLLRRGGVGYFSGIDPAGTDQDANTSYFDYVDASNAYLKWSAGIINQMHEHNVGALDTSTAGDDMHVVNASGNSYHEISRFNEITTDSAGGSLSNRYFTIDVWEVGNKTGQYDPVMIMLPSGSYNNLVGAQDDANGFNPPQLPREFTKDSSVGVRIVRMILQYSGGTSTLEIAQETDLRLADGGGGGGTAGITDHGNLSGLADDDHTQYLLADGSRTGATGAAQDFGANGIETDNIADSSGGGIAVADDLDMASGADVFATGMVRGVTARLETVDGDTPSLITHHRGEILATGQTWQGAPFVTPGTVDNAPNDYLRAFHSSGFPARGFASLSIPNTAAAWGNPASKFCETRVTGALRSQHGLRVDVGTDDTYAEIYIDGPASNGTISVTFRYRINLGAVVPVTSAVNVPANSFLTLRLTALESGGNNFIYGYIVSNELGGRSANISGFNTPAITAYVPAAGRYGYLVNADAGQNPGFFDYLRSNFNA